jgi:hypothetical protein
MPTTGVLDAQTSQYENDFNVSGYSSDLGFLPMAVMGPAGTPPTVIRMHGGIASRNVKWAYKKRGTPPVIPAMQNTPSGDILLATDLAFPVPAIAGDENSYDYVASGEYEYVQSVTRGANSNFQTGRKPYQSGIVAASIAAANTGRFVAGTVGGAGTLQTAAANIAYNVLVNNPSLGPTGLVPIETDTLPGTPLPAYPTPTGWITPVGNISIDASAINFASPNYQYFDTGISNLFFSPDLIL